MHSRIKTPEAGSCSARLTEYSGLIDDLLISRMVNIYGAILQEFSQNRELFTQKMALELAAFRSDHSQPESMAVPKQILISIRRLFVELHSRIFDNS